MSAHAKLFSSILVVFITLAGAAYSKAQANPRYETSPDDCYVIIDTDPGQVSEAICGQEIPMAYYIVGKFWNGYQYTGSRLDFVTTNPVGCRDGAVFATPSMPSGWNDLASSAKGLYNFCWKNQLFEHTNFAGLVKTCGISFDCANLSLNGNNLDNKVSSVKWRPMNW